MKGITPVIAIILLLMITIALAGFAFVWFGRVGQQVTNQTAEQLAEQQRKQATSAIIDNIDAANGIVTIRNSGTVTINTNELGIYVDGTPIQCTGLGATIAPGATATCTNTTVIPGCVSVRITTVGTGDQRSC